MTIMSTTILLFSNAVTFRRDKSILFNRSALVILSYCAFVSHELLVASFLLLGLGFFNGLLHITHVSQTFRSFIYFVTIGIIHLTAFYPRKMWNISYDNPLVKTFYRILHSNNDLLNKMGEQFKIIEYPLIILFIILGGLFLMSSSDIVSIFLAIELQSYGLYILAAIYKNSELSVSAALVYFLLGGLSSCFILLGSSLIYSNSASTILDGHYIITGISNIAEYSSTKLSSLFDFSYIAISLLIMSVGLLFKVSAAPFHFWSPDVYDAIPTIVTTFVAIIAKISILVLLLELVLFTSNLMHNKDFNWSYSLLISSIMSFVIGTVLGLSQPRLKRLLAYSTISHIAFILLALAINTVESIEAFIFYILQYTLSNLCAFIILLSIGFSSYFYRYTSNKEYLTESGDLPERNNSPIQLITELRGYFYVNPLLALTFAIVLFSFVGIPPLLGFFAKQMVLSSAINNGYIFISIIAILTSVISASYYLNIIKEMFFISSSLVVNEDVRDISGMYTMASYTRTNVKSIQYTSENFTTSSFLSFTVSILTLLILLFMLASQEWLRTTRLLSLSLFDT